MKNIKNSPRTKAGGLRYTATAWEWNAPRFTVLRHEKQDHSTSNWKSTTTECEGVATDMDYKQKWD